MSPRRWSATTGTRRIATCRARPPPSGSFTRQALAPVVVGVVFGLVVALGATRVLTALLYGVSPHDPATLAAAALTLLTTTAAAGAFPAWRATRTNLMRSLQAE